MNRIIVIGRLTKDPETRWYQGKDGDYSYTTFFLAVDRPGKDAGCDYFKVKVGGKTSEIVEEYCRKGDKIAVSGMLRTDSWEVDGEMQYNTYIYGQALDFCGQARNNQNGGNQGRSNQGRSNQGGGNQGRSKQGRGNQGGSNQSRSNRGRGNTSPSEDFMDVPDEIDEELPFN